MQALSDIDLLVESGTTGLLGPNGSGKTTLMKLLTGLLRPDTGQISVNDISVQKNLKSAMLHVGSLIEQPEFYSYLTGYETLEFACRIRGLSKGETISEISRVAKTTGCIDYLNRRAGGYSRGMKQRLGLSLALAGDPEILILDEPTFGLDPKGMRELSDLILDMKKSKTILFSTHLISEARELCDRVVILDFGRIRYDSASSQVAETVKITVEGRLSNIPDLSEFGDISLSKDSIVMKKKPGTKNSDLIETLVSAGVKISKVEDFDNIEATYLKVVEKGN